MIIKACGQITKEYYDRESKKFDEIRTLHKKDSYTFWQKMQGTMMLKCHKTLSFIKARQVSEGS